MPASCVVRWCKNTQTINKAVSFHRLPTHNPMLLGKWIFNLKVLQYSKSSVVCSDHFKKEDFKVYTDKRLLKENAVPFSALSETPPKSLCAKSLSVLCESNRREKCKTSRASGSGMKIIPARKLNLDDEKNNTPNYSHTDDENLFPRKLYETSSIKNDHSYALPSPKTLKARLDNLIKRKQVETKTRKIVTQKVRRLKNRIATQDEIIKNLKKNVKDSSWHSLCDDYFGDTMNELFQNHRKGKKTRKYSDKVRQFAVTLHFYSPHAYNFLRKHITLPDPRTIRQWASSINGKPGFTEETLAQIKAEVDKVAYTIYVTLIFDEMAIKKQLDFDGEKYVGYSNLGHEDFDDDNAPLAHEALVFFCKPLNGAWKFPVGYCLLSGLDSNTRANIIVQYLKKLHETGVVVVATTCDGNATNISAYRHLGVKCDLSSDCWFSHPCDSSIRVSAFLDVVHMLKLFRNLLGETGVLLAPNGNKIEWNYLVLLNNLQKEEGLHCANKLRDKHIFFQNQKMKVNLAAQTFSRSVAKALLFLKNTLHLPEFQNVDETVKFIEVVDVTFDVMNSVNIWGNGSKAPIRVSNKNFVKETFKQALSYFTNLKMPDGTWIYLSRRKTPIVGFILDMYSTLSLAEELVWVEEAPLKYLLGRSTSQDHIEKFFSSIRKRTGNNNNPTALEFRSAYRKCILGTVEPSSLGNCSSEEKCQLIPSDVFFSPELPIVEDTRIYEDLSSFSSYVVEYISGFIGKKIKNIKCDECINISLLPNEEATVGSLIDTKNVNNSLTVPSPFLITVCSNIEKVIRASSDDLNKKDYSYTVYYLTIKNIGYHFFATFDHFFADQLDHDDHSSHFNMLLKLILQSYLNLRAKHIWKLLSEKEKGVSIRQKFNKLVLFKGQ